MRSVPACIGHWNRLATIGIIASACGRIDFDPTSDGSIGVTPPHVLLPAHYVKASNTDAADQLGFATALSADGSTLAVSAWSEDGGSAGVNGNQADNSVPNAGAVYVYARAAGTWVQQVYLKASNPDVNDEFGVRVALSADGSTLAVGADGEASASGAQQSDNSTANSGAVYVFARIGTTWTQQAFLKASNADANDLFSRVALSADGSTLVVGAPGEASAFGAGPADNSKPDAGAVYVFTRTGTTWGEQAVLKAANADANDLFGQSVAISADGTAVFSGATGESSATLDPADNTSTNSGAAYVFSRAGTTWSQDAYLKPSSPGAEAWFGFELAVAGDGATLVVGAEHEASAAHQIDGDQTDRSAPNAGAAYVFAHSTTWSQVAYLKATNTDPGDQLGFSVAITHDGRLIAVGANLESSASSGVEGNQSDNSAMYSGAAYLFARFGTTWSQLEYLKATNTTPGAFFGFSTALSGNGATLAIGADQEHSGSTSLDGDQTNVSADQAGAAYLFE